MRSIAVALAAVVLIGCTTSTPDDDTANETAPSSPSSTTSTAPPDQPDGTPRPTAVGPVATTPLDAFESVDFPPAKFVSVSPGPVNMAYVDAGPADGPVVLLLHGNPAWSYYFAGVINVLAERGYRVIAPDLIGFGRSDKPLERSAHTYANHIDWICDLVVSLNLTGITLHAHDWGGLIGMRVVPLEADRFSGVGIVNTGLPTGDPVPDGFAFWQRASQRIGQFSAVIERGTTRPLSAVESVAFDAPWPTDDLTAGARQLPLEVPFDDDPQGALNAEALEFWARWTRPFAIMFAAGDNAGAPGIDPVEYAQLVPGTIADQPQIVEGVGHFLHLDVPELIVAQIVALS